MVRYTLALAASTLVLFCGVSTSAQQPRREVKWNIPDGPKIKDVTHGSFHSEAIGQEVGYNVYLPPGYAEGEARYPVVYFLHGAGGNENSDAGGFSALLAKQAAENKGQPAICVFPNGGMSGYRDSMTTKGETLIIKELIPLIDKTYRTKASREGRVICGFSMGGGGAIRLALKHPDLFSAAGSWAAALGGRGGSEPPAELSLDHLREVAGKVRLYLVVGDEDNLKNAHTPFVKNLEEAKYPHRYQELPGVGHNLGVCYDQTGDEMAKFLVSEF